MIEIKDNRRKDCKSYVRDLVVGDFFEYDNSLFMKTFEGSPTHFRCYNFHTQTIECFCGSEEVEIIENITITIEKN